MVCLAGEADGESKNADGILEEAWKNGEDLGFSLSRFRERETGREREEERERKSEAFRIWKG